MRVLRALVSQRAGAIGVALMSMVAAAAVLGPLIASNDPLLVAGPPLEPPSRLHLMGTDALGRDLFSGVMHGARTSLIVAFTAGILALIIGSVTGMIAGYRGGLVDDALMRMTELFQVMPRFFVVVIALAVFGPGTHVLVLVLGATSWSVLARVVRAEVLATRNLGFVGSTEALGASRTHVLVRVLFPHVLPSALVVVGLIFGQVLLVEASVGFLGLGDPGAVSWGRLAGQAQGFLRTAWWLPLFPGLAITTTVLGVNLLADAFVEVARKGSGAPDEQRFRM